MTSKPPRPNGGRPKGRSKRTPENRDFVEENHVAFGGSMTGPEIQKVLEVSKGTFDQLKGDVEVKLRHEADQQTSVSSEPEPETEPVATSMCRCPTCGHEHGITPNREATS